jgi:hypothetical protein
MRFAPICDARCDAFAMRLRCADTVADCDSIGIGAADLEVLVASGTTELDRSGLLPPGSFATETETGQS